jgi:hypothetical protein
VISHPAIGFRMAGVADQFGDRYRFSFLRNLLSRGRTCASCSSRRADCLIGCGCAVFEVDLSRRNLVAE